MPHGLSKHKYLKYFQCKNAALYLECIIQTRGILPLILDKSQLSGIATPHTNHVGK